MCQCLRDAFTYIRYHCERLPLLLPFAYLSSAALLAWHLGVVAILFLLATLAFTYFLTNSIFIKKQLTFSVILILITSGRILVMQNSLLVTSDAWEDRIYTIHGTIQTDLNRTSSGRLAFEVETELGRVLLWCEEEHLPANYFPKYGDEIEVRVLLSKPPTARNPGSFDYQSYLLIQGIPLTGMPVPGASLKCLSRGNGSPLKASAFLVRQRLADTLAHYLGEEAALPQAMLLARKDVLPDSVNELYANLGLSHILVTSGAHVGLLIGVLEQTVQLMGVRIRLRRYVVLAFLIYYTLITAFAPAVLRAVLTRCLSLIAVQLGRSSSSFQNLLAASFILLLLQPALILQTGFQLSLIMTALIICCSPQQGSEAGPLSTFKLQGTAMIVAIPTNLYLNGVIHLLTFVINLTLSPVLQLSVLLCLPLLLFSLLPLFEPLAMLLALLIRGALSFSDFILTHVASWSQLYWRPNYRVTILVFSLSASFIVMLAGRSERLPNRRRPNISWRRKKVSIATFVCLLIVLTTLELHKYVSLAPFSLTALDIGQGDSLLLREKGQGIILIDSGKPGELEYIWQAYIRAERLPPKTSLILTHLDLDHHGGAPWLIEHDYVDLLALAGTERAHYQSKPKDDPKRVEYEAYVAYYRQLCASKNIPLIWLESGTSLQLSKALSIQVLESADMPDANNASLVAHVNYHSYKLLLTGDAEGPREEFLLDQGVLEKVHLLKLGHHGSKHATTHNFIQRIDPDLALISVGQNNTYGHPADEVLERLDQHNTQVVRTDLSGAVRINFTNEQMMAEGFLDEGIAVLQSYEDIRVAGGEANGSTSR